MAVVLITKNQLAEVELLVATALFRICTTVSFLYLNTEQRSLKYANFVLAVFVDSRRLCFTFPALHSFFQNIPIGMLKYVL